MLMLINGLSLPKSLKNLSKCVDINLKFTYSKVHFMLALSRIYNITDRYFSACLADRVSRFLKLQHDLHYFLVRLSEYKITNTCIFIEESEIRLLVLSASLLVYT